MEKYNVNGRPFDDKENAETFASNLALKGQEAFLKTDHSNGDYSISVFKPKGKSFTVNELVNWNSID